eukprot:1402417-Prorocentrum_lima.AAC.1
MLVLVKRGDGASASCYSCAVGPLPFCGIRAHRSWPSVELRGGCPAVRKPSPNFPSYPVDFASPVVGR